MMKKLLLTMIVTMLTFVGAWADGDAVLNFGTGSTWTFVGSSSDNITGVAIYVAKEGDLATIKDLMTFKGKTADDRLTVYNLDYVKGCVVTVTGTLSEADMLVLAEENAPIYWGFLNASTLDLSEAEYGDDVVTKELSKMTGTFIKPTSAGGEEPGGEEPGGEEPGGSGDGGETPTNNFGTTSSWSYADGVLTINLNATSDLTSTSWNYGGECPWNANEGSIDKVVFNLGNDTEFNNNVLYIFFQGKHATILDLSNLTDAQLNQLKETTDNLGNSNVAGQSRTLILPEEYVFTATDSPWNSWGNVIGYTPGGDTPGGGGTYTAGTVTTSADGKTLTITCSGDVCNPDPASSSTFTTYKFQNLSTNELFAGEEKSVVNNNDLFNPNKEYFTATPKYVSASITEYNKYTIKEGVENAYSYNETNKTYTKLSADADVTDALIKTISGEEVEASLDGKIATKYFFKNNTGGTVYKVVDGQYKNVDWNHEYDSYATYVVTSNAWNPNAENTTPFVFTDHTDLFDSKVFFVSNSEIYKKDGNNYIDVSGTEKPADDTNTYYAGISFTDAEKTNTELCASTPCVKTNGQNFYKGDSHTPVVNGEPKEDVTYYTLNGYEYLKIEPNTLPDALVTSNKLAPVAAGNYWESLANDINAKGYETIVFKTKENDSELATICYHVTQSMMKSNVIKELDYSNVQIDDIISAAAEDYSPVANGTFAFPNSTHETNGTLKILRMPHIKNATKKDIAYKDGVRDHYHVPQYVGGRFTALEEVVLPDNCTCVEANAFGFSQNSTLKKLTMNNGLRFIGDRAFNATTNFYNLIFPASMEYIGRFAFSGGINDVVFLGKEAPIVRMRAFSDMAYLNNNGIKDDATMHSKNWYRITRDAYVSNTYMAAMLHLPMAYNATTNPDGITAEQRARYTDITRDYHVFNWNAYTVEVDKEGMSLEQAKEKYTQASDITDNGDKYVLHFDAIEANDDKEYELETSETNKVKAYRCGDAETGDSVSPAWGKGDDSGNGNAAAQEGLYVFPEGGLIFENGNWKNGYNHHKYGLYDLNLGMQYVWPGQQYMNRAFSVASNGLLWDGTRTIQDGIVAARGAAQAKSSTYGDTNTASYDTDCDGADDIYFENGEEYIGLHQFILVNYDVTGSGTDEWEFNTIGGANWWTLCAPVDMTAAEVRKTFGENTQVCKFSDVSRRENKTLSTGGSITNTDKVKFYFCDEQCVGKADNEIAIHANVAYMIHPSNNLDGSHTKFVLPDFKVAPNSIPVATEKTTVDQTDGKTYTYRFIGNYNTDPKNGSYLFMPQYSYYLGNAGIVSGKEQHKLFIQGGTAGTWKPFTAVILPSDGKADFDTFFGGSQSSKAVGGMIGFDEYDGDAATSVQYEYVFGAENAPKAVYNLNGQKIGNTANNLPSGIYIVDGKKYVVK